MRKFLNGEREFTKDQIVYFIEQDRGEQSVSFGKVDRYIGGGVFYIIVYDYPQLTNIHSASFLWKFAEVDLTNKKEIKDAIGNGILTEGILVSFDRSSYRKLGSKVYKDDIFTDYTSAKQELDKRNKTHQEKLKFLNETPDYDYTLYEVEQTIKYLTEESKSIVREKILTTDVSNIFSMKIADGRFKYNYFNGEYIDLCQVEYKETDYDKKKEIEDGFPEHYLVTVSKSYDADRPLFVREFTNDSPDVIFEKYGKDPENILRIVNRKWSMDDGLKTPVGYIVGYDHGETILITNYKFSNGSFDLRNGKIGEVNIYLDGSHCVNNSGFHRFSMKKSSLSAVEFEKKFYELLIKAVGNEFGNLIYEKMIRSDC